MLISRQVVVFVFSLLLLASDGFAFAQLDSSTPTALQIRDSVLSSRSSKMEDVLTKLPESLRRGFTLSYASRSRLDSSARYPAVLLFGDNAKTLIAFNGHVSQRGFAALDILEFDETTGFYRPSRFLFEPTARDLASAEMTEKLPGVDVYFEAKPQACARCHGSENHPIFESGYPEWNGFYGSSRDHLYGSQLKGEIEGYRLFQKVRPSNPRYATLLFPSSKVSSVTPYLDEATEKSVPNGYAYTYRPNLMFGAYLVRNNAVAVFRKLKSASAYRKYRAALAFSLERCDFGLVEKSRLRALKENLKAFGGRQLNSTSFLSDELRANREIAAQLAAQLGVSADFWSLSLKNPSLREYGYWSGYGDTLDFVHAELVRDIFGSRVASLYTSTDPIGDLSEGGQFYSKRLRSLGTSLTPRSLQSCRELAGEF